MDMNRGTYRANELPVPPAQFIYHFFNHSCDIQRRPSVDDEQGGAMCGDYAALYEGIPCRCSTPKTIAREVIIAEEYAGRVIYNVYFDPSVDVQRFDQLVITRGAELPTITGIAQAVTRPSTDIYTRAEVLEMQRGAGGM